MNPPLCMTMVYNEERNLDVWVRYYSRQLGPENLLILDHGSDVSVKHRYPQLNVLRLPRAEFSDIRRSATISALQEAFIKKYPIVIYTDCDEIIVPDPISYASLEAYLQSFHDSTAECVRPVGLNVFQSLKRDSALDLKRDVLSQRSFCYFHSIYCKPIITKAATRWSVGFHHCSLRSLVDSDLYLFHLRDIDFSSSNSRLQLTRSISWSSDEVEAGLGAHQRFSDEQASVDRFQYPDFLLDSSSSLVFDFRDVAEQINMKFVDSKGPAARIPARFVGLF